MNTRGMTMTTTTEDTFTDAGTQEETIAAIPELVGQMRQTFAQGRSKPLSWRLNQLRQLKALLLEGESTLLKALAADLGKSDFEGIMTELNFVISEIDLTIKHLPGWVKPEKVAAPLAQQPGTARIHRDPLGVVLIIGPWNYPIQLVLAPLVGAISAGNCAIIKPSEVAPHSSAALATLIPQYMDNQCVRVVEGGVPETSALLKERFDHIFFTGGEVVGKVVMRAAAEYLTPVTLELGGKSPCIVAKDADLQTAARRIVWGKFLNAGQTCIAPDYVLVHPSQRDALVAHMRQCIDQFYGTDPRQSPDFGQIINKRHHQRLCRLLDSGTVATGGQHNEEDRYIAPTILTDVSADDPVMGEEIFGPILPILTTQNLDEAIDFINARPRPLALYIFSQSKDTQQEVIDRTSSGGVCINDTVMHISVPELPFGGVGTSGMGAYHGKASFETFSHRKSILSRSTRFDPSLRYPPYGDLERKVLKKLF